MEITEVRIKLMENSEDRLRAFCSITIDQNFVVRDLKIIEGNAGPFVAMPSRKLTGHCRNCNSKNHLRARFCNNCGKRQSSEKVDIDDHGRAKLYADIAHPINATCRELIQKRVIEEFHQELVRAKMPDYASRYDDDYDDERRSRSNESQKALSARKEKASTTENELTRSDAPHPTLAPHTPETDSQKTPTSDHQAGDSHPQNSADGGPGDAPKNADFGRGIF